ncbi:MAG: vanadium-dependent haloperoxidase [Burkholderiaceae bacterium]
MKLTLVPVCSAILLSACGGGGVGDAIAPDAQALSADRAAEARPPVVIVSHGENAISEWGAIAFKTAGNVAAHDFVTVHLAMYDAVMAIAGTHQPYAIRPTTSVAGAGAQAMKAAAIEAAYLVLKGLFPAGGANYEAAYTAGIAGVPDGADKTAGRAIGAEVAAGMLALRANDGRLTTIAPYVPGTTPGDFRGVNPVNRIAPYIRPFATLSHSQFRAPGPLALASDAYAIDLNEVKDLASTSSITRTVGQTEVARFHTENPNTFWARNLRQFATASTNLAENARLAAMLWTAYQDAISGCFESKYHYNFWRPTSAIRLASTDGNAATIEDATWTPVVGTPNHPEYPAAHGCGSGAVTEVLRDHYATKKIVFSFDSSVTGTTHPFERSDDLVKEVMNARVWGGMHFRTSIDHGAELGKDVAKYVLRNNFQPVSSR